LVVGTVIAGRRASPAEAGRAQVVRAERTRRWGRLLMAGVVSLESVLLFGFTYLSAPTPQALQLGSVRWLQANLGSYRFYTLGPIQPNYGSYFGIGQANVNDLPFPNAWNQYVLTHLDPNSPAGSFTGGARVNPAGPTPAQELTARLAAYEAVGVRFVVENANGLDVQGQPFPAAGSPPWPAGPRLAYRDGFAEIWQLPSPAPVFSLSSAPASANAGPCMVVANGLDEAVVHCSHPTTLVRRVQYMKGWMASAGGAPVVLREDRSGPDGLFQAVSVPPGTTVVRFAFTPPHAALAFGVAALAMVVLVGSLLAPWARRRRRAAARSPRPADAGPSGR
ncbi:MAG TPA: hypothetical protein VFC81_00245, partial [Verrucomicrobiae bacterium]|nr:hypothetical protein [Verrucomicrobiae bacterium]